MKKTYTIILVIILTLTLLTACGRISGSGKTQDGDEGGLGNITIGGNENNETQDRDWKSAYAVIFQAYEEGLETDFADLPYDPEYICYAIAMSILLHTDPNYDQDGVSDWQPLYALSDINNDGISELMIGETWKFKSRQYLYIFDIWTLINDTPYRLTVKQLGITDSSGFFISTKNYIADTSVTDSAYYTIYSFDKNGIDLIEKAIFILDPSGQDPVFKIDSKEVSKEEYINGLEESGFIVVTDDEKHYPVSLDNPDLGWASLL